MRVNILDSIGILVLLVYIYLVEERDVYIVEKDVNIAKENVSIDEPLIIALLETTTNNLIINYLSFFFIINKKIFYNFK